MMHTLSPVGKQLNETCFNPWEYRKELEELRRLFVRLLPFKSDVKAAMVISFLRRHALRMNWVHQNVPLTKAIVESKRETESIQKLFEAHKDNESFCKDLEHYIELWLP